MVMIIRELAANGNTKAIASLRLVSKSWRAAVREQSMTLENVEVARCGDLRKLCKIVPKIDKLAISCNEPKVNLRSLSGLTSLRAISIAGCKYALEIDTLFLADLSHLPSSLTKLQLSCTETYSSCLRSLKITDLRVLTLQYDPFRQPKIWSLLQCLPNLEVKRLQASQISFSSCIVLSGFSCSCPSLQPRG